MAIDQQLIGTKNDDGGHASTVKTSRVHMIWTRDIDAAGAFGRLNMARAARAALATRAQVSEARLRSLLEIRSPTATFRAVGTYAASLLRLRPLPLQCLLFADKAELRRLITSIPADAGVVYVDGVRSVGVLRHLRRMRPDLGVVTDLDDLMSRRMRLLLALGEMPSAGYLKRQLPGVLGAVINSRLIARILLRYEATTLHQVETEVVRLSDACVLVSTEDARLLAERFGGLGSVVGIAPPTPIIRPPAPLTNGSLRFVFIGSDTLRQNQLTIDRLLGWWRDHSIATPLAIYGEQERELTLPLNVTMPGYIESLDDVYDGTSILLSPSYLAGGIKTKVLEAFGRGVPVIGNTVTFEGMDIGDYPLLFDDEAMLLPLLHAPEVARGRLNAGAAHGAAMVRTYHDPARFTARWTEIVNGAVRTAGERVQLAS